MPSDEEDEDVGGEEMKRVEVCDWWMRIKNKR